MIRFACPECHWTVEASEDQGGSTVRCPCCGRPLCVPTLLPVDAGLGSPTRASVSARPLGRMATAVARRVFPWWQFGSPVSMLLALVLFALPWVEVRCDRPLGERGSRTLARQSGLQAAYGGYSEVALQDVDRSERERMEARVRAVRGEPGTDWSPLLVAYPLVLIGGGVLGLLARRERLRRAAAVACSLAAGLLFLVQAFRGLPLERAVRAVGTQGNLAGADFRIALSGERLLEVRHTPWFWLSAGALVVAAALACGGGPWGSRTRSLRHDVGL